eukprot:346849-Rhodomonas_salina.2
MLLCVIRYWRSLGYYALSSTDGLCYATMRFPALTWLVCRYQELKSFPVLRFYQVGGDGGKVGGGLVGSGGAWGRWQMVEKGVFQRGLKSERGFGGPAGGQERVRGLHWYSFSPYNCSPSTTTSPVLLPPHVQLLPRTTATACSHPVMRSLRLESSTDARRCLCCYAFAPTRLVLTKRVLVPGAATCEEDCMEAEAMTEFVSADAIQTPVLIWRVVLSADAHPMRCPVLSSRFVLSDNLPEIVVPVNEAFRPAVRYRSGLSEAEHGTDLGRSAQRAVLIWVAVRAGDVQHLPAARGRSTALHPGTPLPAIRLHAP